MAIIRANGIDIHYEVDGKGPWLTLSHSLACDLTMWDDQVKALADQFTILRYDARGHGTTSAPREGYSFEVMVADLIALLDALQVERTHFLGLSMGGMIGQHFALAAPERLDRLVLASTTSRSAPGVIAVWEERIALARSRGMEALVEPTLARWFTEPYRYGNPKIMQRIGELIRNTPVDGYVGCGPMAGSVNTTDSLARITAPTLVLVGDEDAGTPPAMAEIIARAIPGARLEVLPLASHLLNIEQAQLFNALVAGFLEQASAVL